MILDSIKTHILRLLLQIDNQEWRSCHIVFQFAPFINKGYVSLPLFWDENKNSVRLFLKPDEEFNNALYQLIYESNQSGSFNQIVFKVEKVDLKNADIEFTFNQDIDDKFQNNLPKSKRGKTLPWWKIDEETKGLKTS